MIDKYKLSDYYNYQNYMRYKLINKPYLILNNLLILQSKKIVPAIQEEGNITK